MGLSAFSRTPVGWGGLKAEEIDMSVGVEVDGHLGAVEIDISEGNLAWVLGTGGGQSCQRWLQVAA